MKMNMNLNIKNIYKNSKTTNKEKTVNENYNITDKFSNILDKKVDNISNKKEKIDKVPKNNVKEKNNDNKNINKNETHKKNIDKKIEKSEIKDANLLNEEKDEKSKLEKDIFQLLAQLFLKLNNDKENEKSLNDTIKELSDSKDPLKMLLNMLSENNEDNLKDINLKDINLKDKNDLKELLKDFLEFMEKPDEKENLELMKKLNSFMEKNSLKDNGKGQIEKEDNVLLNLKEMLTNDKVKEEINSDKQSEQNSSKNQQHNLSKEDKLLEKLTGNNDNKFSKVNQFMNLMNTSKVSPLENLKSVENLVINKTTFNDDIIKSLKYMEINNLKDLTVKINPKNLGEVIINLTMDSDIMKAQLKSSNKETFALLNASLNELNEKLNENMKIQQVEVSIYNEDTTYFSGQSNKEKNSSSNNSNNEKRKYDDNIKIEEIDSTKKEDLIEDNSNVNLLI